MEANRDGERTSPAGGVYIPAIRLLALYARREGITGAEHVRSGGIPGRGLRLAMARRAGPAQAASVPVALTPGARLAHGARAMSTRALSPVPAPQASSSVRGRCCLPNRRIAGARSGAQVRRISESRGAAPGRVGAMSLRSAHVSASRLSAEPAPQTNACSTDKRGAGALLSDGVRRRGFRQQGFQ